MRIHSRASNFELEGREFRRDLSSIPISKTFIWCYVIAKWHKGKAMVKYTE